MQEVSIGDKKVLLALLKTKECADHAGHFQQLEKCNAILLLNQEFCQATLNNNWSIVQMIMATMDAMVD